jgi:transcriptional regulator with XRE-family HTH domain
MVETWLRSVGLAVRYPVSAQSGADSGPFLDIPLDDRAHAAFLVAAGEVLQARRVARKYGRDQLAEAVELSPRTVGAHLNGARSMSLTQLLQYCGVLGISPVRVVQAAFDLVTAEEVFEIDLAALAVTTNPELAKLRRWAAARLQGMPEQAQGVLTLEKEFIPAIAALCGLEPTRLIAMLAEQPKGAEDGNVSHNRC